jgi:hypothetical protein
MKTQAAVIQATQPGGRDMPAKPRPLDCCRDAHRNYEARRRAELNAEMMPPDLQELVAGGYNNITPEASEEFDRKTKTWQQRMIRTGGTVTLLIMIDFAEVITRVVQRSPLRLVVIDGLPLAGKSTRARCLLFISLLKRLGKRCSDHDRGSCD